MLGEAVDSPEMERAASLARRAAESAAGRYEGRALFAAHAGLPWPEPPHLVVWHAQTLLREFRGDGHIMALVDHDLDPVEALVMHEASGELPGTFLRDTRGWPDTAWDAGAERLAQRGLLQPVDTPAARRYHRVDRAGDGPSPVDRGGHRPAGHRPYRTLGEEGCAELRTLARPFSRTLVKAAGMGSLRLTPGRGLHRPAPVPSPGMVTTR